MKYSFKEIGERIQNERNKLGLSQDEFIYQLNCEYYRNMKKNDRYEWKRTPQTPGIIGRNTLSDIENGKVVSFDLRVLSAMASLFNCEIGYILCEDGYENKTRTKTDIVEETSLSEESVDNILSYSGEELAILDCLLESKEFRELLIRTAKTAPAYVRAKLSNEIVGDNGFDDKTKKNHFTIAENCAINIDAFLYNVSKDFVWIIEQKVIPNLEFELCK